MKMTSNSAIFTKIYLCQNSDKLLSLAAFFYESFQYKDMILIQVALIQMGPADKHGDCQILFCLHGVLLPLLKKYS